MNDNVSELSGAAASLLEYGFLGLSVIMIGLGFWLLRDVLSRPNASPAKLRAVRFFIASAFVFMVTAGVLEGGILESVKKRIEPIAPKASIRINVVPWEGGQMKRIGEVHVRYKLDKTPFNGDVLALEVEDDSEIALEIYNLTAALRELQSQVNDITIERGMRATHEAGL
jgi:hypothetical protein